MCDIIRIMLPMRMKIHKLNIIGAEKQDKKKILPPNCRTRQTNLVLKNVFGQKTVPFFVHFDEIL